MTESLSLPISLRPVDRQNWQEIINLKVGEDQKGFVASNLYSLAEAKIFPECRPLAIYAGDEPIGFSMYAYDADLEQHWILRLMIEPSQQGKGYGRKAMRLVIALLQQDPKCNTIYISFEPHNDTARRLYSSLGFLPTGEIVEGEIVYRLDFQSA